MTQNSPLPIFDGHNDCLLDLLLPKPGQERSFFEQSDFSHIDYPRLRTGGLAGGIFAMFIPQVEGRDFPSEKDLVRTDRGWKIPPLPAIPQDYADLFATNFLDLAHRLAEESEGAVAICTTVRQIRDCLAAGTLAIVLHFEGAEAVQPDLSNLASLYDRGMRSLGIVWSRPNAFGEGVPFQFPSSPDTGPGLTTAGQALVRRCNEMGILVDLAHLNEKGFWDAAAITSKPLVVSHAAVHALTPTSRNLTDEQIDAIGDSNGLFGITFCVTDIRPDGDNDTDTPITDLVRHIRYVAERTGVDHVALGSDYDGATVPRVVSDVSKMPVLIDALRDAGFDQAALRKITSENWLRVLQTVWE